MSDVSRETRRDGPAGETSEMPTPPAKNKRSSFYVYLAILFGAAFLMLLLAYFIQQRNNESTISDLRNSMNLSRDELMEEIERLEGEQATLNAEISELKEQLKQEQEYSQEFQVLYDGAQSTASHLAHILDRRTEAMELFCQLDKAYAQGRNQQCRELIEWLEKDEGGPLKDFLPNQDDRENYSFGVTDGAAPAERYQEIVEKLS